MTDSYGWTGKVLWVDLTTGKTSQVPTSDFEPEKFIGGVGLNSRIFWELGCPKVDAYHSDSPIILSTGPLTGASGPFSRATICAIAPQCYPEELFTYSGFGGKFPSELKYAGYDGLVIVGKADRPVYLSIDDGDVEIKDAANLWGLDTFETQTALGAVHPRASVLTIGPAGENRSRMAIIITETSGAAGQGGYGAVMGSKNLKAIVTRGTGTFKIARPDVFWELVSQRKAAGEWVAGPRQTWGRYPQKSEAVKAEMERKYLKKFTGCYACPYQCHGVYDIPGIGKGAQLCNDNWYQYSSGNDAMGENIQGMWEGNILSQKLGINNFELVGVMLFFYRTIKETGILTKEDFGLSAIPAVERRKEPEFGGAEVHHQFLAELLGGIADGTSPLSQGVARAAEQFGPRALELYKSIFPAWGHRSHHIRGVGEALHWATDTRDPFNSCHDYTNAFGINTAVADWFGVPGGYLAGESEGRHKNIYEGTERLTAWVQNHQSLRNSLHICEFASSPELFFHPPEMDVRIFESQLLSAVTGLDVDVDELWKTGERIWNLRRSVMVLREDRHKDDDTLFPGMFEEVFRVQSPELMSEPLDRERWDALKDRYYELRGWNVDTGRPTRAKLVELGMKDVADELQSAGKIG
ncbi:MAG: aldehyde ferredoxin oxidoreductase N-terminal domain-containing protein [Dehalococcoidia bacterium]